MWHSTEVEKVRRKTFCTWTTSRAENKAVEFTRKELQSLNQSKIKRELEKKPSWNEGSGQQEDMILKLGKQ